MVGVKTAVRAAAAAASRSSVGPFTARAEITLPFSSIVTSTVTAPVTRMRFAVSGKTGFGNLTARPLSKPPATGACGGAGVGAMPPFALVSVGVGDGVGVGGAGVGVGVGLGSAGVGVGVGSGVGVSGGAGGTEALEATSIRVSAGRVLGLTGGGGS